MAGVSAVLPAGRHVDPAGERISFLGLLSVALCEVGVVACDFGGELLEWASIDTELVYVVHRLDEMDRRFYVGHLVVNGRDVDTHRERGADAPLD